MEQCTYPDCPCKNGTCRAEKENELRYRETRERDEYYCGKCMALFEEECVCDEDEYGELDYEKDHQY